MTLLETSTQLTSEEALVLQQVYEDIETDVTMLSRQLGMRRGMVMSILNELRQKHLVSLKKEYAELLVNVSARGRQLIRYIWPEQSFVL
ncbi:MAG TPA: hypothetical protein PKD68_00485 [Candidatus Saccharibacteria bacterium]|nr:hypothetical protein [Candidatus Saccharibacteria bacterium]